MSPSRRHRSAMLVVVLLTSGCSIWRPLPGGGLAGPRSERLAHARIAMRDGTRLELDDATITPDSITGLGGESRTRLAVARREVASLDARQPDNSKTFRAGALTAISMMVLYVGAVILAMAGERT